MRGLNCDRGGGGGEDEVKRTRGIVRIRVERNRRDMVGEKKTFLRKLDYKGIGVLAGMLSDTKRRSVADLSGGTTRARRKTLELLVPTEGL